jgi:hypothetical protein
MLSGKALGSSLLTSSNSSIQFFLERGTGKRGSLGLSSLI